MISDIRTKWTGEDVLTAIKETAGYFPEITASGTSTKDFFEKETLETYNQEKSNYRIAAEYRIRPLGCGYAEADITARVAFISEFTGTSISFDDMSGHSFDDVHRLAVATMNGAYLPAQCYWAAGSKKIFCVFGNAVTTEAGDELTLRLRMFCTTEPRPTLTEAAEKLDDATSGIEIRAALVNYLKTLNGMGRITNEGHFQLAQENISFEGYERKGSHGVTDLAFTLTATFSEAAEVDSLTVDLSDVKAYGSHGTLSLSPAKDTRAYNAVITRAGEYFPAVVYIRKDEPVLHIDFENCEVEAGTTIEAQCCICVREA